MGYRLNRLDEPVLIAVSKRMLTEFGIHYRLESCELLSIVSKCYPAHLFEEEIFFGCLDSCDKNDER